MPKVNCEVTLKPREWKKTLWKKSIEKSRKVGFENCFFRESEEKEPNTDLTFQ